eukprot:scaffold47390_cov49-Attheya_sp.AAC.1
MGETHYDENDTKNGASETKSQHEKEYGEDFPLPTSGIPDSVLKSFDEELIDFGAYVKLRNNELESRNYLVEHIQSVAQDVFYKTIRDGGRIQIWQYGVQYHYPRAHILTFQTMMTTPNRAAVMMTFNTSQLDCPSIVSTTSCSPWKRALNN